MDAYKTVTGEALPKCPPILYLPVSESNDNLLSKVQSAEVLDETPIETLTVNRCVKCAAKYFSDVKTKELVYVEVENERIYAKDSVCHPCFIPKYSTPQKIIDGCFYIVTFRVKSGFSLFYNNEEICIRCKNPPGYEGCTKYGEVIEINGEGTMTIETLHSTQILRYKHITKNDP